MVRTPPDTSSDEEPAVKKGQGKKVQKKKPIDDSGVSESESENKDDDVDYVPGVVDDDSDSDNGGGILTQTPKADECNDSQSQCLVIDEGNEDDESKETDDTSAKDVTAGSSSYQTGTSTLGEAKLRDPLLLTESDFLADDSMDDPAKKLVANTRRKLDKMIINKLSTTDLNKLQESHPDGQRRFLAEAALVCVQAVPMLTKIYDSGRLHATQRLMDRDLIQELVDGQKAMKAQLDMIAHKVLKNESEGMEIAQLPPIPVNSYGDLVKLFECTVSNLHIFALWFCLLAYRYIPSYLELHQPRTSLLQQAPMLLDFSAWWGTGVPRP